MGRPQHGKYSRFLNLPLTRSRTVLFGFLLVTMCLVLGSVLSMAKFDASTAAVDVNPNPDVTTIVSSADSAFNSTIGPLTNHSKLNTTRSPRLHTTRSPPTAGPTSKSKSSQKATAAPKSKSKSKSSNNKNTPKKSKSKKSKGGGTSMALWKKPNPYGLESLRHVVFIGGRKHYDGSDSALAGFRARSGLYMTASRLGINDSQMASNPMLSLTGLNPPWPLPAASDWISDLKATAEKSRPPRKRANATETKEWRARVEAHEKRRETRDARSFNDDWPQSLCEMHECSDDSSKRTEESAQTREVKFLYLDEWEGFHSLSHLYDEIPVIPESYLARAHWAADHRNKEERAKAPMPYNPVSDPPLDNTTDSSWYIPYHRINASNGLLPYFSYFLIDFPVVNFYRRSANLRPTDKGSPFDVCIVTQCSVDRLPMVRLMAHSWDGPISLAVYVSFDDWATANDWKHIVDAFFEEVHLWATASVDIHLLFETEARNRRMDGGLLKPMYPVNALRNLALKNSHSDFVFLIDADFVPSLDFHSQLIANNGDLMKEMAEGKPKLMLIPTWELRKVQFDAMSVKHMVSDLNAPKKAPELNFTRDSGIRQRYAWHKAANGTAVSSRLSDFMDMLPLTFNELSQLWGDSGTLQGFHFDHCKVCHGTTNFARWKRSDKAYRTQFMPYIEPYVIVHRKHAHLYDARYRGYGMNKIVHIMYLGAVSKMKFMAVPHTFIISAQHPVTAERTQWKKHYSKYSPRKWLRSLNRLTVPEIKQYKVDASGFLLD